MIIVTRINGARLAVNSDLIQRVEATPDTVITLTDGSKLVVAETVDAVIDEIRTFRASVLVAATTIAVSPPPAELRLLASDESGDR